jgi:c-di-GMP-related signal transduction protein
LDEPPQTRRLIRCGGCADRQRVTAPVSALTCGEAKPAPKPGTRFVARQPIFTTNEKVFGYELLFRDGVEDFFQSPDPDAASRSTLNTSMLLRLDVLCDGHRAFINCTREILLKDYITLLPSEQTVVEVLETVPADDLVVAACRRLKEAGYVIALDDFAMNDPREVLTDLADIIKVDLRSTSVENAAAMVKRYGPWRCRMLAEKVETREERARFCELLSPIIPHRDSDLFLMGLLSLMDTMLEIPMRQVLENVPIDQESRATLLGEANRLWPFYQLMLAQEAGEWNGVTELTAQLHLSESEVASFYLQAMEWARQVTAGT